jgi:hypothetical protein
LPPQPAASPAEATSRVTARTRHRISLEASWRVSL